MYGKQPGLIESQLFDRDVIHEIQRAATEGIYDIRGWGAKRRLPHFDDLVFLGASMSRYPLEGYRERCDTNVTLGTRYAKKPIELKIPITVAGMSFGSLSAQAKEALGRGASAVGTSTTTGDGGMTPEERQSSKTLVYQLLPSRYGMNPDDLRRADAIEIVLGQGAKPGGGGMLLGQKISPRVAAMRDLPPNIDQRSACRHPDWTGPDDLEIKIRELREITDWEKPIYIKVGASRTYYDTMLAVKAGADVIVVDGMQGGTAATQTVFIEHVGIPTLAAVRQAVEALIELDMHRKVQLIVSGGIRTGADVAKALAMGADAVSIGVAALIALGDNSPALDEQYRKIGSAAGYYDDWQAGNDPAGITTQNDELAARLDPVLGGRRLANYLRTLTMDIPRQEVITRDNVTVNVNAVAYFRVVDASMAMVNIADYVRATSQIAQTTLRSILGQVELDELLAEREVINQKLQAIIDEQTEPWGVKVSVVEIKDVELPESMQRAMARQAEAEREKRAKIIHAEGESLAAQQLHDAAVVIAEEPIALQLRFLQTLTEVSAEKNSTILFPVPVDLISAFINLGQGATQTAPAPNPPAPAAGEPEEPRS